MKHVLYLTFVCLMHVMRQVFLSCFIVPFVLFPLTFPTLILLSCHSYLSPTEGPVVAGAVGLGVAAVTAAFLKITNIEDLGGKYAEDLASFQDVLGGKSANPK